MSTQRAIQMVEATVAFAADSRGVGVAYTSVRRGGQGAVLLRVPFRVERYPALREREVSYAALTAVSKVLRQRGVRRVRLGVSDPELVADVTQRRSVPPPLMLPYVRLGCTLNRFDEHHLVVASDDEDLHARARAEATLAA